MSFDRVIQDSDDEDDPLLEDRPPRAHPPPVIHESDNRASYRDTSNDPLNDDSSRQLTVNFDQFLGSQDGGQAGPTSSQQRREERWIPGNAGGGSIGTMMNEIGLAQQRLFDDEDAQHGAARLSLPEGYGSNEFDTTNEYDDGYIAPQQPEIHIQSNTPSGSYVSLPPPYGPHHDYTDTYHQPAPAPINHSIGFPSYEHTQSATSYNLFESSLRPSESTYSENNTTLKSHQTIPTEAIQRSPRRWNSTEGTISSPHDTEPNSSILAAKSSRSKSDINSPSNKAPQPPTSVDELSLPVDTEAPATGKKRGRPKKQSLPDVDGDDEPAQLTEHQAVEQPPVPEKRKPGRPPKSAKNLEANGSTANAGNRPDDIPSLAEEPKTNEAPDQVADTFQFQALHPNDVEPKPAEPPKTKKASKEPPKKKLKRGKTTSVTLQKTYESDVEDDVIWVESRPSNTDADANPAPFSINIETPAESNQPATNPDQAPAPAPDTTTTPATTDPAPKKRGRKRKKTSEQAPAAEPTEQPQTTTSINPNTLDTHTHAQPEDHHTSEPAEPQPNPPLDHEPENQQPPPDPKPPMTPQKPDPKTPNNASTSSNTDKVQSKGPDKHSPISSTSKVPYRVGLSRRARIAPLLKIVKR